MDTKQKIIVKAEELFRLYGVKSVTMDEIARELGMSKKTLYQSFNDKDSLVSEATQYMLDCDKREFEAIESEAGNSIEQLFLISKCLRTNFENMNPSILFDLKRYHPQAWEQFLEMKEKFFKQTVINVLNQGIDEGYFRKDINVDILTILRVEQVQMTFDPRIFPKDKFDFKEVQMQFFDHFVNGIMTDKGRIYYNDLFQTENVKQS
ncbi:MAG: TetR/AcrR family transcriptional regulator [Cyclobacteriaceae bacterium]